MAKFDFNDCNDVKKLKTEINNILESRIQKLELESALKNLSEQPFGAIKNVFEGITDKLYETTEGKKIIGKYVRAIRENKNTADAYSVYEFVYHSPHVSNPNMLLTEALYMVSGMDKQQFAEGKKKIAEIVAEGINLVGKDTNFVDENINRGYGINEAIDFLMLNPKNFDNLDEYINKFSYVENHLTENMAEKPVEPSSRTGKELIDSLNEAMDGLNSWEKEAISDITLAKLSNRDMSELFEEYKNGCIEKIDENIEKGATTEEKSRFETMKRQLSEKQYSEENLYEDIVTLSELRATLSE